jgi:TolB-like protein/Tfp pilus assembly protein PilF
MVEREPKIDEDQRIRLRIGVNLGDIIVERGDIFGDGVNVAARLEGLAEPGGLCLSGIAHGQVRDKLPYAFTDQGEQTVKNIAQPVRVYAMSPEAVAETPLTAVKPLPHPASSRNRVIAALGLVALVAVGGIAWRISPGPHAPTQRLSIVVLPLANLWNDPEQDHFVDAITDDLTTDLSRIPGSFVIAHTTAFTYKGKALDVKQIGRELGVRYVLEGSVRPSGGQTQINVQLIDTESGAHVWARRFDIDRAGRAKVEDEIVGQLARALQLQITEAAARQIDREKPANLASDDQIMRGWAAYYRTRNADTLRQAEDAFERALAIDPQSPDAKIGLATVLTEFVGTGIKHVVNGDTVSRDQDLSRSDILLAEAAAQAPDNQKLYFATGRLRRLQLRLPESRIELEKGLELDRNSAPILLQLGITLIYFGDPAAALPHLEKALRLTPGDPSAVFFYFWPGIAHLLLGHADEAVELFKKSRAANPKITGPSLSLAAALGYKGDIASAKLELAAYQKMRPDITSLAAVKRANPNLSASPEYEALRAKTIDVGLRRAGLPDQ